jgi:hypothetical protein
MSLHPDVCRLAETLGAMVALLNDYEKADWADQIGRCKMLNERSDFYGVERLPQLYGGMGSLGDIVLQKDSVLATEDNAKFKALRSKAWEQARLLARDEGHGSVA